MARGYSAEGVWHKTIQILRGANMEMSSSEISKRAGMSRITMAKYLHTFETAGMVKKKNLGNTILWSLASEPESFDFPDDYFRVATEYALRLLNGDERTVFSLVRDSVNSGATTERLVLEVVLPAISGLGQLYEGGKIGTAERNLMEATVSRSLYILEEQKAEPDPQKNVIVIAADMQSRLLSEAASTAYRTAGWTVSHLGDMSSAINVLFDLDFQKLVRRVWKKKLGLMLVVIFSNTEEGLNFFADSIRPLVAKSRRHMRMVLCGRVSEKTKLQSDLVTDSLGDALQWSATVSEGM